MAPISEDLLPILRFEIQRGNSVTRVDQPAGTRCTCAVILKLPIAVSEIKKRLKLPDTVEYWENRDPHYPIEAGFFSTSSRHAIAGPCLVALSIIPFTWASDLDVEDVLVRVYFGSWSPICERIVPKIMALDEAWGDVRFEYYGLPQPLVDDPHAAEMGITGVPTVVVFRGDDEVGRLSGRVLDEPGEAVGGLLAP